MKEPGLIPYSIAAIEDGAIRAMAMELLAGDPMVKGWGVEIRLLYDAVYALSPIPLIKHRISYMQGFLHGVEEHALAKSKNDETGPADLRGK